jgi:hypothetical protein
LLDSTASIQRHQHHAASLPSCQLNASSVALQVQAGQEEHLQQMQLGSNSLWQALSNLNNSSSRTTIDIGGFVPDWSRIQLGSIAPSQLPAVLKLLETRGPAEAAGQLEPGSAVVLAWLAEHQVIEACLRHGIAGQGELLRSVYDFCPRVLRVASLLADHRRNALLGKRLLQQPLQSINDACCAVSSSAAASHSNSSKQAREAAAEADVSSSRDQGVPADSGNARAAAAAEPEDAVGSSAAGSSSTSSDVSSSSLPAHELLQELLSGASPSAAAAATNNSSSSSPANPAEGLLRVLGQLQHLEEWAYSQVSDVVLAELGQVLSGVRAEGFVQREAAAQAVLDQWVQGCDELVEARRLGRRGLLEKLMHQVGCEF